jgi:hypothetical protein
MAHGFRCKRCGAQQTEHLFPLDYPGVCRFYISPDWKAEAIMWQIERGEELESEARKRRAMGIKDDL